MIGTRGMAESLPLFTFVIIVLLTSFDRHSILIVHYANVVAASCFPVRW